MHRRADLCRNVSKEWLIFWVSVDLRLVSIRVWVLAVIEEVWRSSFQTLNHQRSNSWNSVRNSPAPSWIIMLWWVQSYPQCTSAWINNVDYRVTVRCCYLCCCYCCVCHVGIISMSWSLTVFQLTLVSAVRVCSL